MAKVTFYRGTQAQYDALGTHSPDALYFTQDTRRVYLGDSVHAGPAELVRELPATGEKGILYVLPDTQEACVYTGTSWVRLGVRRAFSLSSGEPPDDSVPTVKAVRDYIDTRLSWKGI